MNWFVHESPGLKSDWFGEIKLFSMKYSNRLLYIKRSKTFHKWEVEILADNSLNYIILIYNSLNSLNYII